MPVKKNFCYKNSNQRTFTPMPVREKQKYRFLDKSQSFQMPSLVNYEMSKMRSMISLTILKLSNQISKNYLRRNKKNWKAHSTKSYLVLVINFQSAMISESWGSSSQDSRRKIKKYWFKNLKMRIFMEISVKEKQTYHFSLNQSIQWPMSKRSKVLKMK